MSINQFFENTLKVKCANKYWSWGAIDTSTDRVFLRVWEDELLKDDHGEKVQVYWNNYKRDSNGDRERRRHLEAIRDGAEGYGVVCRNAPNHSKGDRKILDFDEKELLKLGEFFDDKDGTYARIAARVPTVNILPGVPNSETVIADIEKIRQNTATGPTIKEQLVDARIGQGTFRVKVLALWDNKCAVTGSTTLKAIRASHIKPWRDGNDVERLDPMNGLPLVANLDALFDVGLISFHRDGRLMISPTLSDTEATLFGLAGKSLRLPLRAETKAYLEFHFSQVFVK